MTCYIRPSDGAARQGGYLNLNWQGFAAGDRVLFEVEFGRPEIGTIAAMDGNRASIAEEPAQRGGNVFVTAIKHRIRSTAGIPAEAELLRRLATAHAEAPHTYDARRAAIVKAWERQHKPVRTR